MYPILVLVLGLLSNDVSGQTAAGFPVQTVDTLEVVFEDHVVNPPGELIPRALTANPPTIYTPTFPQGGTGLVLMVDQTVPINQNSPLRSPRVSLIHWLAPNVTLPENNLNNSLSITNPGPNGPGITYLQPTAPVGDIAHKYNILLFTQPPGFKIPPPWNNITEVGQRFYFNITAFTDAAGLSQPLAANYFEVQQLANSTGVTGTASSTAPAMGYPTAGSPKVRRSGVGA
ncbi:PEBP-like protein [Periconia macrospinosa]|uniref:PEBP-like protein n=1 Tax=Periconia macrospinosa TaxID=97972 RepID=A0A2V1D2G6_9PLEO|nr:PEBP-like protein [Periconia macrospinosa]